MVEVEFLRLEDDRAGRPGCHSDHQVGLQLHDLFNIRIQKSAIRCFRCDFRGNSS